MKAESLELKGSRILVVDDVAENRRILTHTLESAHYSVSAAPGGELALRIIDRLQPDVILLDVQMPGMDGFEVCQRIKEKECTAGIPVIFITANNDLERVVEGFRVGAVDFISKPFRAEEVLIRVETHLKISRLTLLLKRKNRELTELNAGLKAEIALRKQTAGALFSQSEQSPGFFHVAGTLKHNAPSYMERAADSALLNGLLNGELCYILTCRQMGKSSLMARCAHRLKDSGLNVVVLDLTAIGQNLTAEQWYDGMLSRMGRTLNLEDAVDDYWFSHSHVNPVRRFFSAISKAVLPQIQGRLVIFIDELDVVRSLPFDTDEFFAAIRECYNRRTTDEDMRRLVFSMFGVSAPRYLISNPAETPFNVATRIPLNDFERQEIEPLAKGLGDDEEISGQLLDRIHYWTNGQPYLTQKLCKEAARRKAAKVETIDVLCEDLFLCLKARENDDNLVLMRERLLRIPCTLESLRTVLLAAMDRCELDFEDQKEAVQQLIESGLLVMGNNRVEFRNRIYEHVFQQAWHRFIGDKAEV